MPKELALPVPAMIFHDNVDSLNSLKQILMEIGYPDDLIFIADSVAHMQELMTVHLPNLILVDLSSASDVLPQLKQSHQDVLIIGVSPHNYIQVLKAIHDGIYGYIFTDQSNEEQKQQIITTLRGGSPLDSELARMVVDCNEQAPSTTIFTDTELDILNLRSHDISLGQIAEDLHIAEYLITAYIKNIYRKISAYRPAHSGCLCS